MYNIHALREQWDYYTIASKLSRVIALFVEENEYKPNEIELSEATGLTRGQIRRCQLLINLPQRFKDMLLMELELPKSQQKLSEDFFIEMERSLRTVTKRLPEYHASIDEVRDTLVEKFRTGKIKAVTDFRQLSKIATAVDNLGVAHKKAKKSLDRVFDPKDSLGIREAYKSTVEFVYEERQAGLYIDSLIYFLDEVIEEDQRHDLDDEIVEKLRELFKKLKKLVGS